jgi:hypothetical protein
MSRPESATGLVTVQPDGEILERYRAAGGTGPAIAGHGGGTWCRAEFDEACDEAGA